MMDELVMMIMTKTCSGRLARLIMDDADHEWMHVRVNELRDLSVAMISNILMENLHEKY